MPPTDIHKARYQQDTTPGPADNAAYQQVLDIGQDGLLGCIVEQRGWDVGERMGAFLSGRTPQGLVTVLGAVAAAVGHEPLN